MEKYQPVPIIETDKRVLILSFVSRRKTVWMQLTQLDLLQIRSHLKEKNDRLYEKITRYILGCDEEQGEKTDLDRKLPKRKINGADHDVHKKQAG